MSACVCVDAYDEERLRSTVDVCIDPLAAVLDIARATSVGSFDDVKEGLGAREATREILRSLPRPLMPLLEFLYRSAKYSHMSLSWRRTGSPSR